MKRANGMSNLDIVQNYVDGVRPFNQLGYDANLENSTRKEGETWTDSSGKNWVKKNGFASRVSNKGKISIDKRCNECNADTKYGNYLDDRVWPKTGLCYDCFVVNETKLKISGQWGAHNRLRELRNIKSMTLDMKLNFEEAKKFFVESNGEVNFMEEDGSNEAWIGKEDMSVLLKEVNEDLKMVDDRLLTIDSEIESLERQYEPEQSA
jgi:hypothetical protein